MEFLSVTRHRLNLHLYWNSLKVDFNYGNYIFHLSFHLTTLESHLHTTIYVPESGLEPSDKYEILEEHNKLRQAVAQGLIPGQPGAENMLEMVSQRLLIFEWSGHGFFVLLL